MLPKLRQPPSDSRPKHLNTGLMWEKLSDDGSIHDQDQAYLWAAAFAGKIASLNSSGFAGHSDWRLPNIRELRSIVNYFKQSPAISNVFNAGCSGICTVLDCSCTVSSNYWSSSSNANNPSNAWNVNFNDGHHNANNKTNNNYVRAVRGGS